MKKGTKQYFCFNAIDNIYGATCTIVAHDVRTLPEGRFSRVQVRGKVGPPAPEKDFDGALRRPNWVIL